MVDRLWTWRQNLAQERRLRYAKLTGSACVEDIDYRVSRVLERTLIRSLANDSGWVRRQQWHEQIGDATIANGIFDRLVHNAHHIELRGESMRKTRAGKTANKEE